MDISGISVRDFLERNDIDFRHTDQKIELNKIEKLLIDFGLECVEKQRIIGCVSESQRLAKVRNGAFKILEDIKTAEDYTPKINITL